MERDELIDILKQAGLSPYQATAYVTLLELGTASATQIAEASGIPGPRIYDVLRDLSDRGYIEIDEEDAIRARTHSPAQVLEDLRGRADRFNSAASEVDERWEQPELKRNEASVVNRFQTVLDRARLFIEDASEQVHLSVTPKDFERLRDPLEDAHDRGVPIHVSIHTHKGEDPPASDSFSGVCKEVRHRELPAPFVVLTDRRKTCFSHHPDSFDQYGVLVNDQTHTYVFYWYFLTCLWEPWDTIYSERGTEPPIEYVDIRRLVRETRPLLEADATIEIRIEGYDLETGDKRRVTGTVAGIQCGGNEGNATLELSGQVTILVDTGDEEVSVGGWGAVVEDVEATRFVIEDVDRPVGTPRVAEE